MLKYFVHTNHKAPQLENAYGSMINVLDACLVNGFGSQTVESLTVDGDMVTADFGQAHQLLPYQVVKIEGAVQDEFNGEHRILDVSPNRIRFKLTQNVNVNRASGVIQCSLAPLGWEKPFASQNENGGGKAAYRSLNTSLASRPFLRVVDELDPSYNANWAKYAKVGMVDDMLDIDTMLGKQYPFDANSPQKNWQGTSNSNGWAKWFYAANPDENSTTNISYTPPNGARSWIVIGNQDYFYILNRYHTESAYFLRHVPYFFGQMQDDYLNSCGLVAILQNNFNNVPIYNNTVISKSKANGLLLNRQAENFPFTVLSHYEDISSSNRNYVPTPSHDIPVVSSDIAVFDKNKMPRGYFPSVEHLMQRLPYQHLQTILDQQRIKLAVGCLAYEDGMLLFDLGELP